MNDISFFFIMLFGVLFGYIFPELLEELGLSKKTAHSWIAAFFLAFLSFLGFLLFPLVLYGRFVFNSVDLFYKQSGGIFLWLAIALLLGGAANLAYQLLREKK